MSDSPAPPGWLGPATDRLKECGLDEAARWLADHLALVEFAEDEIRSQWDESTRRSHVSAIGHTCWGPLLAIAARARGETPEDTFRRLAPTWHEDAGAGGPDAAMSIDSWGRNSGLSVTARNSLAAGIAMAPLIERELARERQQVEDFLCENGADPGIHEHVVYPAPELGEPDHGQDRHPGLHFVSRGRIHALIPWSDMEGRSTHPTLAEVMSPGSRWPWRRI